MKRRKKVLKAGGVVNSEEKIRDENNEEKKTIEKHFDNKSYHIPLPEICSDSKKKSGNIAKGLQKFIDKVQKLEEFSEGFIDPITQKIVDIDEEIEKASQEIEQAMGGIIRNARFKLFEEINEKVDDAVDFLKPDFLKKQIEAKKLKDGVYCAMENILNGLKNVVGDFLKGLIGNILNVPLCAAEQFLSGLMSMLNFSITAAIAPLLGGLSKFTGSVMPDFTSKMTQAMEIAAAALSLFECEGQECDANPADFLSNKGLDLKKTIDPKSLLGKFTTLSVSGLVEGATDIVGLSFPNVGGNLIDDVVGGASGSSPLEGLVGGCNVTDKQCGPPRIEIFGGGGLGAVADAVINETGKIIGVNMQDFGSGYKERPFVSIIDDCDNGKGASGVAIMDGDQVVNIGILNPGGSYLSDGVSDSEGVDVIGEIVDVNIISTGAGYEDGDLVVSESGQALTPIIEDGRIIGVQGKIDQGLTDIPSLTVETNTGFGAKLIPITRFVKREEYTDPIVPQAAIVTVISCPRFY